MEKFDKNKFRTRKEWREFRKSLKDSRKVDPITGSKLTEMCHCHHLSQDPERYTDLNPDNFLMLNNQSHDTWHFIYGSEKKRKNWVEILNKLRESFILADKIDNIERNADGAIK